MSAMAISCYAFLPYNCTCTTTPFCASKLSSFKSNAAKILEEGYLRVNRIQFDFCPVEVEPYRIIVVTSQLRKRMHPLRGDEGFDKTRRHSWRVSQFIVWISTKEEGVLQEAQTQISIRGFRYQKRQSRVAKRGRWISYQVLQVSLECSKRIGEPPQSPFGESH